MPYLVGDLMILGWTQLSISWNSQNSTEAATKAKQPAQFVCQVAPPEEDGKTFKFNKQLARMVGKAGS